MKPWLIVVILATTSLTIGALLLKGAVDVLNRLVGKSAVNEPDFRRSFVVMLVANVSFIIVDSIVFGLVIWLTWGELISPLYKVCVSALIAFLLNLIVLSEVIGRMLQTTVNQARGIAGLYLLILFTIAIMLSSVCQIFFSVADGWS